MRNKETRIERRKRMREERKLKGENMNNKWYEIPCSWEVYGTVEVAATSLDEAIEKVEDNDFPLPSKSSYVDGSFQVDRPIAEDLNS